MGTLQIGLKYILRNVENYKEPVVDSLKQGLIVFVALLIMLFILNYFTSIVHARSIKMLNILDIATALVGFALVFGWKFLESSFGRR